MIAVFLYTSCYDVTVLHVTLLLKHFNKLLFALLEKLFMFYRRSLRLLVEIIV